MRRIGRYMLNAVTVVSAVFFIAILTLWACSFVGTTTGRFTFRGERCEWRIERGVFAADNEIEHELYKDLLFRKAALASIRKDIERIIADGRSDKTELELLLRNDAIGRQLDQQLANWPHGVVPCAYSSSGPFLVGMLAAAIAPAVCTCRTFLARRRRRSGACVRCGYDLRATPDRCPECGTVPSEA